jgi:phage host-nuclease inhibitor protein Gam
VLRNSVKKQREKIYALQEKYNEQIEGLTKQIADLKTEMNDECRELLSDEQKTKVDALTAAAKKKADDRKKAKAAKWSLLTTCLIRSVHGMDWALFVIAEFEAIDPRGSTVLTSVRQT